MAAPIKRVHPTPEYQLVLSFTRLMHNADFLALRGAMADPELMTKGPVVAYRHALEMVEKFVNEYPERARSE